MVPVSPFVSESNTDQRSIFTRFSNSPHSHLLLWSRPPVPAFQDQEPSLGRRSLLHCCTPPLELSNQTHQRQHKVSYHSWNHVLWCHNDLDLPPPKSNQFISKRTAVPDLIKSLSRRSGDIVLTKNGTDGQPWKHNACGHSESGGVGTSKSSFKERTNPSGHLKTKT